MTSLLKILIGVLTAFILVVFSFLAGFGANYVMTLQAQPASAVVPAKFPLVWEAWRLVKDEFYGQVPQPPAVVHGMIRGMLASLGDSHTILVDPQPAQAEQNSLQGSYGGIGARVESRSGFIVLLPFPTGPAASAGIMPNDILLKIDDKELSPDWTPDDIELRLRGDIGSRVKLQLHRVGEISPIEVTLTREKIDIPSVQYRMLDNTTIGYIQVSMMSSDTSKEFEAALNALKKNNPTGLILDLRGNPGGVFPDPVLSIAGEFLPPNTTVVYEHYRDGSDKSYDASGNQLGGSTPLAVLVNGGTASDAEILAGALQDTGRAILVGDKTFGKGTVQTLHTLSDKSVLHVTVATWLTPKKNEIDGVGLKPDLAVPLTPDDAKKGTDPQLDRAVQYLQTGK